MLEAIGKDVKRLFEETIKVYGGLDVLVNNAGIYTVEFKLVSHSDEISKFRCNPKACLRVLHIIPLCIHDVCILPNY